jgi:hypothetical protein
MDAHTHLCYQLSFLYLDLPNSSIENEFRFLALFSVPLVCQIEILQRFRLRGSADLSIPPEELAEPAGKTIMAFLSIKLTIVVFFEYSHMPPSIYYRQYLALCRELGGRGRSPDDNEAFMQAAAMGGQLAASPAI